MTFRLPRLAYLVVLLLAFGVIPFAFTKDGTEGSSAAISLRSLVIVVPVIAAVFIRRTATVVDRDGIRIRAAFGARAIVWDDIRGLSVNERSVYAVLADGAIRLPCVRVADLAALSRASGGRLPEVAEATPKAAPARRRRR